MKKIFMVVAIVAFMGCSADVDISTLKAKGGPLSEANVLIYEGSSLVAQNGTNPAGKLSVNLDYGNYTIKANKNGYQEAQGSVDVNLFGSISGISIDIPLAEGTTAE